MSSRATGGRARRIRVRWLVCGVAAAVGSSVAPLAAGQVPSPSVQPALDSLRAELARAEQRLRTADSPGSTDPTHVGTRQRDRSTVVQSDEPLRLWVGGEPGLLRWDEEWRWRDARRALLLKSSREGAGCRAERVGSCWAMLEPGDPGHRDAGTTRLAGLLVDYALHVGGADAPRRLRLSRGTMPQRIVHAAGVDEAALWQAFRYEMAARGVSPAPMQANVGWAAAAWSLFCLGWALRSTRWRVGR